MCSTGTGREAAFPYAVPILHRHRTMAIHTAPITGISRLQPRRLLRHTDFEQKVDNAKL